MARKEKDNAHKGIDRRLFLKIGLAGTAAAVLGVGEMADAVQSTLKGDFVFPDPVYRTLGRTGLKITVVSFGAMLTPEPEVIRFAFDHGVNYVDTARRYMDGRNEEIVGRALKGKRGKVHVATKALASSRTKEAIIRDVETSLKTLGIDTIDVIQLHSLTGRARVFDPEAREALARLKAQGKVRFFGVTTHTGQAEVLNALVDDPDRFFDTALVGYNFKSDPAVKEAIHRAARANIGIIAMKTQAGGYETGALGPVSPHQAALKWVLQDRNVTAAIPGMRNMAHLREDIAVMGMRFGYRDERILQRYGAAISPYYCRLCARCEPTCARGVMISTINRSLMYSEGYRDDRLARIVYREIPASASAATCAACPACTARCVHGIDIAARMEKAGKLLG
jgi:hypothetical protein